MILLYQVNAIFSASFEFQVFTGSGYDRPDAKDLVIVFTDGQAHDAKEANEYSAILKRNGVRILGIGAGPYLNRFISELEQIASDPGSVFTFTFGNLTEDMAGRIVKNLAKEICLPTELIATHPQPTKVETPTTVADTWPASGEPPTTTVKTTTEAPTTFTVTPITRKAPRTSTEAPTTETPITFPLKTISSTSGE